VTSTAAKPLTDYRLGFADLEREVTVDQLPLDGALPEWLSGTLLRTGPAKFAIGERVVEHWFDGLAMLHRFAVLNGQVVYAYLFLLRRTYRAAAEGHIGYMEFGTDPCRSIFKRVTSLFHPEPTDNCSVNLARLGERFIAMTEAPMPLSFDPDTLETLGPAFTAPGQVNTAHPHHDPATDELIGYAVHFGRTSAYRFYATRNGAQRRKIASVPVRQPAYLHSFGLTDRHVVLVESPLVVHPLRLASMELTGTPFIANYRWRPERGTRITLVDRSSGAVEGEYRTDPFFFFHHVNAFEDGDDVVVDLVTYDDAAVIDELWIDRLRAGGQPVPVGELRRLRLGSDGRRVEHERLSPTRLELPRIDYTRRNGRPYRHVYGISVDDAATVSIVKIDTELRRTRSWTQPGQYPGEPVFVPEPGGEEEDAGVLLSVVLDTAEGQSALVVLDARDLSELARARVPHHVPFHFHGEYFADSGRS